MSDVDKSTKTEPPTEKKKLSESRSKGQFAKAPEIGMTFTLLAGLLVILFLLRVKHWSFHYCCQVDYGKP